MGQFSSGGVGQFYSGANKCPRACGFEVPAEALAFRFASDTNADDALHMTHEHLPWSRCSRVSSSPKSHTWSLRVVPLCRDRDRGPARPFAPARVRVSGVAAELNPFEQSIGRITRTVQRTTTTLIHRHMPLLPEKLHLSVYRPDGCRSRRQDAAARCRLVRHPPPRDASRHGLSL